MPAGRPSDYSQEIVDEICARLSDGQSLRSICKSENLPSTTTVCKWLAKYPEFADQYARAREAQADYIADEILDIADDSSNDWMERDGLTVENGESIRRSQLRIDARKWLAGKLRPKKYSDKLMVESKTETTFVLRAPSPSESEDKWLTDFTPAALTTQ
jgi:hypothetical protein